MNANELADELEKVIDVRHYASEVLRKEVVKMLRQQQKQLELHKNAHHEAVEIARLQRAVIEEQDKKIIELAFRVAYAERSVEVVQELTNERK